RPHCVAMILSSERWLAPTPSVASLQALTSRSSVRFAATTDAPPRRWSRRGRISGRPRRPKLTGRNPPMAPECQSLLDNLVARDRRHLIAELPRGESLARDRFDSNCVLGTQFESSQPHYALSV